MPTFIKALLRSIWPRRVQLLIAVAGVASVIWSAPWRLRKMDTEALHSPAGPGASELHLAVQGGRPFLLRPRAFFISWSGVVTLAFSGWPSQAVALKERLAKRVGAAMRPENPGSLWPKITLGALKEGRQPLSLEELKALTQICAELTAAIAEERWEMRVHSLSQTLFAWPSHEWLLSRFDIPLQGGELDASEPDEKAAAYVETVLKEGEDLESYLPAVQRPGDVSKYRPQTPTTGTSLVAFVVPAGAGVDTLPVSFSKLRSRIDEALPDAYAWMEPAALHCTLRSLT